MEAMQDARAAGNRRVPVYAPFHGVVGPQLSLGRLTAAARFADDGALNEWFDIRKPQPGDQVLAAVAADPGPAIILCSDYLWSVEENLELARAALELSPDVLVVHGGPSAPSYEADAESFMRKHGRVAAVLARGEGEGTIIEMLRVLAGGPLDPARLADVPGLTVPLPDGSFRRTPDRERQADLSVWPSPYLVGEFDEVHPGLWRYGAVLETNRGCPYGCTFCDWGAATLSRVRYFPPERVRAELEWLADRGVASTLIADANFGITKRDVEFIRTLVELKERTGALGYLIFAPAKNTVRHLVEIMELLKAANIDFECNVGIQSFDPVGLEAVARTNIAWSKLLDLVTELRRRSLTMPCDFIVGLPGQTPASLRDDLQVAFDHELPVRMHVLTHTPNAPMNEPSYRERHALRFDAQGNIATTSSYTEADAQRMFQLVKLHLIGDHFGCMRHLGRLLQWDHGIPMLDLLQQVGEAAGDEARYPTLAWLLGDFLRDFSPPPSWEPLTVDLERLVREEFGLEITSDVRAILQAQEFLLPTAARTVPEEIELEHDVVDWARTAGWGLLGDGRPGRPSGLLRERPPGRLRIEGDPLGLIGGTLIDHRYLDSMADAEVARYTFRYYDLLSPLTTPISFREMCRVAPDVAALERYRTGLASESAITLGRGR